MAMQTRFYVLKGPTQRELHQFVDPTVDAVERFRTPVVIVQYDDSIANIVSTIDAYMDEEWGLDDLVGELRYDVFARPGNPAAVAGRVLVYALTNAAGITQLFARASDGTTVQLSPLQLPPQYVEGLTTSYVSATTVQIDSGEARAKGARDTIDLPAPVNVDITVAGVNGLDTGVESANQWYYIYVIGDSTAALATAGLLSTNQNTPMLPPGYDIYRRVGTVRNQGGDFRDFVQIGTGSYRDVHYRDSITSRQRLTAGAATVVTTVSCGPVIPNTASVGRFLFQQLGIVGGLIFDDPTQLLANPQRIVSIGSSLADELRVSGSRDIAYANAAVGGLLDIYVTGYQESI